MSSDIPAITARLEAATPGPWSVQVDDYAAEDGGVWPYVEGPGPGYRRILDSRDCEWADPEFIAHAPEDIRELLAEVKRLRDAIPDALHPEFGTEWREPDGIIWKAVHAVEVERDEARAEVERSRPGRPDDGGDDMSHAMGVQCPQCKTQTVPEGPCPERCGFSHGSTYILCDRCREANGEAFT